MCYEDGARSHACVRTTIKVMAGDVNTVSKVDEMAMVSRCRYEGEKKREGDRDI